MDSDSLGKRLIERIGQTVLTCPTTACFDGLPDSPDRMAIGKPLRTFGDGFQASKVIGGQRYWRVPVMEGEFLLQETFGKEKGVGGGNFLILGGERGRALDAAEAAVDAMAGMPGVILPFPGGIVRSGSKVGAKKYKAMIASTNDAFAPTLRPITNSALPEGVNSVLEIVLDGLDFRSIAAAMRAGIDAACRAGVRCDHRGKLRRQARSASLPSSQDHERRSRGRAEAGCAHAGWVEARGHRMSGRITLTLRSPLERPLDADVIAADRFAALDASAIPALHLWDGRNAVALGDVFTVSGERSSTVVLEGDLSRVNGVGTAMVSGVLEISGSIGNAVGARMRGGAITVQGSTGNDAGSAMTGGSLVVAGNVGDRVGGALQGALKGMTGGAIIVRGSAGREAGARMRRGILYCALVGAGAGLAMIAGNIIVGGAIGDGVGIGNKRGSIVALGGVRVPPTYAYACTYRPPHLLLMLLSLRARYALAVDDAHLHGLYRRYSGDLAEIGKGEILEWQAT